MIRNLIQRSQDGAFLTGEEIAALYELPLFSEEAAQVLAAGRRKSERACGGLAEVHAQVGLNIAPCPNDCLFCSFASCNGIFAEKIEFPVAEVVARARQFESDGANAVFVMCTADHPFARFIEVSQEIRRSLRPETVMVANVGDCNLDQAQRLQDIGFAGVYHALRLGEGRDTSIPPEKRLRSMRNVKEAGLKLGTCVEPVGPEHATAELVEKTIITREAGACYSGAARRIPIPGTELEKRGLVSEARMAHILAVVRLALGYEIPGKCTHEPNGIGALAGANLLWAEAGANPRDTEQKTEEQRGFTVPACRRILAEAGWRVLKGPSRFYAPEKTAQTAAG
jgi:biotin synthase